MLRTWLCLTILGATVAQADDWPQWMGPKRDNVWRETGLVDKLPSEPKIVWRTPVGGGYSGPAVAGGKVYVTDYVTKDEVKVDNFARKQSTGMERILCLDEKTGKQLWMQQQPETYTISYPTGPRATPIVHDGKVYAHGAEGQLACLNANSGDVVWTKSLKEAYKTKAALWGYSSQPLIDGIKYRSRRWRRFALRCVEQGHGRRNLAHGDCHRAGLFPTADHPSGGGTTIGVVQPGCRVRRRS